MHAHHHHHYTMRTYTCDANNVSTNDYCILARYVDCLVLHRDDRAVPIATIVDTVSAMVSEGIARSWGVSNWSLPRLQEAVRYVRQHTFLSHRHFVNSRGV